MGMMEKGTMDQKVAWGLVFFLLLRVVWHVFEPIGVVGDEAYYWDWGRRLDWGYFSKPPGIAWIHALAGFLSGQSVLGMKLMATTLAVGGVWFLYRAVLLIAGERVAAAAALAAALVPGNLLLGSFLTTDSQLVFFWNLGFWMSCRIVLEKRVPGHVFWVLGLAIGMGSLFKQMMLVQIPLMWIGMLWLRRDVFRRWEFSVATLGSLVFLVPTLLWNISNDWITAEHTAHHFERSNTGLMPVLQRLGDFYGVLVLLLSPVLFGLMLYAGWRVTLRVGRSGPEMRWLWLWGVLPFVVMTLMTVRQTVNPNWPAVYFSVMIALVAVYFEGRGRWWKSALGTAAAFSLLMMVAPFGLNLLYASGKVVPQLRGWAGYPELAAEVDAVRKEGENVIVVGRRFTASQLAFHMRDQPQVWHWNADRRVRSQYDLWPGPEIDEACLLVVETVPGGVLEGGIAEVATGLIFLKAVPLHKYRPKTEFHLYRADGLDRWPRPITSK